MDGVVTVREWLSATIDLTVPSQDGRLRTSGIRRGGDITAASPEVPGVFVSGQLGQSGMVFTAVVLST